MSGRLLSGLRAVDLFSGAGGSTTGAIRAGLDVVACANHWALAIDTHRQNHPGVDHVHGNLLELDMARLPAHDVLLASPACQGFSDASQPQRRPKHEADRNTCWAVIACAEAHRPRAIVVENVRQISRWPLFSVWLSAFEALGYHVRTHVMSATSFGVPQDRVRFVLTAALDRPIELKPQCEGRPAIRSSIDTDSSGDGRGWATVASRPHGVQRRVAKARARGLGGEPFLVHYSSDNAGRSLGEPIGTVTTKNQWALVRPGRTARSDEVRMLSVDELRAAMSFPSDYRLPSERSKAIRLLGNAWPPMMAEGVCRQVTAALRQENEGVNA